MKCPECGKEMKIKTHIPDAVLYVCECSHSELSWID
jgi:predicted  nucleic acid-binding Zn ribbon protein